VAWERLVLCVSREARGLGVDAAYGFAWGEPPSGYPEGLSRLMEEVVERVRGRYGDASALTRDPVVQAYRRFYWRIGIDPTKTRPSGEALARRILRRGGLPRIHPIVDIGNVVSAETLVPIGIYDLDHATPPFRIVLSRGGEVFHPIGGSEKVLGRGVPVLVDSRGVVMHIYPYRDSRETMVRETTGRVMVVAAGVPGVPWGLVERAARLVLQYLRDLLGFEATDVRRAETCS